MSGFLHFWKRLILKTELNTTTMVTEAKPLSSNTLNNMILMKRNSALFALRDFRQSFCQYVSSQCVHLVLTCQAPAHIMKIILFKVFELNGRNILEW